MKIAIVTDAWDPQINGVVITLKKTTKILKDWGHTIEYITPQGFHSIPCPTYPDIRLALFPNRKVFKNLDDFQADAVHIATEGPLGMAARKWCIKNNFPFTTSYHTQFPEYVRLRAPIPLSVSYAWLRRFHGNAQRTMVPTKTQLKRLQERGFKNAVIWSRGVDTELFKPGDKSFLKEQRPVFMYMGRVAVEKNIEAFLELDLPGTKYVVGDGPDLEMLKGKYQDTVFTGFKFGEELANYLAAADVFVFPSRTDTFGLVLLEALACGVPVAAYPVTGPIDVIENGVTGCLDEDLGKAAEDALRLDPETCREYALKNSWEEATKQFLSHICDRSDSYMVSDSLLKRL
ncbi:MAG: glycosyltransferase family 1 protein [Gammaproteobacteria bacterium]|nr:glycosyltransferase family 1 protein [Gammaproteobacteria bacterium]